MDYDILKPINDFTARHHWLEQSVKAFEGASELVLVVLIGVLFFAVGRSSGDWARRAAVTAILSAGLALLLAKLIGELVNRARPFVDHKVHLLMAHPADASFPSEHTTGAFAIAVAILLYNRAWGVGALTVAILVGVGRVALGVHYPGDVLGGALLGTACAVALSIGPLGVRVRQLADWVSARWVALLGRVLPPSNTAA